MDIIRVTIFEKKIDNDFWPKLVLAITYIKNNWPIKVL